MPFSASWHTLLEECDALSEGATLVTPLTDKRFRITDTQEHRIIIRFEESNNSEPLQREQFATLAESNHRSGWHLRSPASPTRC